MALAIDYDDPGYVPQAHRNVPAGHTKMPRVMAIALDKKVGDFDEFIGKASIHALVQEFIVGGGWAAPVQVRVGNITTNEEAKLGELRTVERHHAEEVALVLSNAGMWITADALCAIMMDNGGHLAADGGHRAFAVRNRLVTADFAKEGPDTMIPARPMYGMPSNLLRLWSNSTNKKSEIGMGNGRHVNLAGYGHQLQQHLASDPKYKIPGYPRALPPHDDSIRTPTHPHRRGPSAALVDGGLGPG